MLKNTTKPRTTPNVIQIKYYDVTCEKCGCKIGQSIDEPTYSICLDCYAQ